MNLNSDLRIRTPEGIVFSFPLAGPITRFTAWVVDFLVVLILVNALAWGINVLSSVIPDIGRGLLIAGFFVVNICYGIVMEWLWRGQTIGKRLLKLRVADVQGLRLQPHQVILRNLLRPVDALPVAYAVGGLSCLLTRHCQRLGDLVANTVVVRLVNFHEPDLEQLFGGKYNSLRAHGHLVARLRQRVSPEEAHLALRAVLRRDELEPAARISLFGELAAHFKAIVAFPPEATDAMPDEQYIRNVVDILFRTRAQSDAPVRSKTPETAVAGVGIGGG